jgi:hypothetical protein
MSVRQDNKGREEGEVDQLAFIISAVQSQMFVVAQGKLVTAAA